jgi:ubiquinone/menaquinone biosynthesis C-methylase UbiE
MAIFELVVALQLAQSEHQHHPPKSAAEYAHVLNDPKRDSWQKPHEVVMALGLRADEVIADIGAGSGYFTQRFAKHAGTVIAVDIEPKLLEMIKGEKIAKVVATAESPNLPEGSADTIFFCNVVHHIDKRAAYWPKVVAALKPGGRIVVLDFLKKQLPVGPGPGMKIDKADMIREVEAAGMKFSREHDFLPYQYFLEFKKP